MIGGHLSMRKASGRRIDFPSPRGPFVAWPFKRVCDEQTAAAAAAAVPGLVFLCDNNWGGPANIRNYILTCIRYAIEAGASVPVMPRIAMRSPTNLAGLRSRFQPFGYMFDEARRRVRVCRDVRGAAGDPRGNPDAGRAGRRRDRPRGKGQGCGQEEPDEVPRHPPADRERRAAELALLQLADRRPGDGLSWLTSNFEKY
ncbi:hypothetical protein PG985_015272 [Apiospora marii]|uniref:Uncharacterized protein n=1 Tax=Apiospora marii TaxID=335849 RepID=A0ABR1S5X1_9PEZI